MNVKSAASERKMESKEDGSSVQQRHETCKQVTSCRGKKEDDNAHEEKARKKGVEEEKGRKDKALQVRL